MKLKFKIASAFVLSLIASVTYAQEPIDTAKVWHHLSPKVGIEGVATEEAYAFLKEKGRKSESIVVAIIDSGTDIEHEDLKENRWINEDEIPNNGIDDDKNGYIDDVYGWNFIGGKDGKNINAANLEVTRLYRTLKSKYAGKDISSFTTEQEKDEFRKYLAIKNKYTKSVDDAKPMFDRVMQIWMADSIMGSALSKASYTLEDLQNFKSEDPQLQGIAGMLMAMAENGLTHDQIQEYKAHVESKVLHHLNLDFDPRGIVGDNPEDATEKYYGNNDVIGASAEHGTHVAGIIGAIRGNNIGMDGIANNVKLMPVRTVPDGDERDKDVANAIRYAVDNGAKILNMSFGKSTQTHKEAVDAALLYAQEKGVLLVHAAGNDGKNLDKNPNFPTPAIGSSKKQVKNWLTVGATSQHADSFLVTGFSNYGKKMVDIFAPGKEVYSTYPNNKYKPNSGTSMASPVVAGVAALVWSHYPNLTAVELRKILIKSSEKHKKLVVKRPTSGEEKDSNEYDLKKVMKFKKLGHKTGVVNALNAVMLAEKKTK